MRGVVFPDEHPAIWQLVALGDVLPPRRTVQIRPCRVRRPSTALSAAFVLVLGSLCEDPVEGGAAFLFHRLCFEEELMELIQRLERLPMSRPHLRLLGQGGLGCTFDARDGAVIAFISPWSPRPDISPTGPLGCAADEDRLHPGASLGLLSSGGCSDVRVRLPAVALTM
ncbi:hypothetical protein AB0I53_19560 [Saccharopolyspora sp. NPDC050389]|uniref:hypothetical protein n=1 Tax=Saccharopolyspora sp. NPDC050389 TaxID=3155516 RepID=UPI0033DBB256